MTQGAGQGPEVRTATLRDFRVPAYVYEGVRETGRAAAQAHPQDVDVPQAHPEDAGHAQPQDAGHAPSQDAGHAPPQDLGQAREQVPGQHASGTHASGTHASPPQASLPQTSAPQAPPHPGALAQPETPAQPGHPAAQPEHLVGAQPEHPAAQPHASVRPQTAAHPQPSASALPSLEQQPTPQPHPGSAGATPEGYTPTERDLPVINRGDTVQVEVREMPEPPPAPDPGGTGPLYVVGDVHGYLDELVAALVAEGLIDEEGRWSAGNTRLWFLGDFTDRGPDGIGVIDLVMRLSAEAAAAGGYCKALMGNHELLLIGAKKFGDTPVNSGAGTATFQAAWLLNGGQKTDMERLEDHHLQWMARLDAIEEEDGHLLVHSDTTAYLDYGDSIEAVNDTIREALTRNDADEYWDLFRKFTKRFAFRDDSGPAAVRELLDVYGGSRIVHGHSPIPYLLGEVGSEYDGDDEGRPVIEGPHVYADGLAIAMDGGVTMAGKLLVCQLPLDG